MEFERAVNFVLVMEGGLVDHPKDPGGLTNFGISLRAFPEIGADGIRNMTRGFAVNFYRTHFWDRYSIDKLPEEIRLAFFDAAVNNGPKHARIFNENARKRRGDLFIAYMTERALFFSRLSTFGTFGAGWTRRLFELTKYQYHVP